MCLFIHCVRISEYFILVNVTPILKALIVESASVYPYVFTNTSLLSSSHRFPSRFQYRLCNTDRTIILQRIHTIICNTSYAVYILRALIFYCFAYPRETQYVPNTFETWLCVRCVCFPKILRLFYGNGKFSSLCASYTRPYCGLLLFSFAVNKHCLILYYYRADTSLSSFYQYEMFTGSRFHNGKFVFRKNLGWKLLCMYVCNT